jgi:hypothetical protein
MKLLSPKRSMVSDGPLATLSTRVRASGSALIGIQYWQVPSTHRPDFSTLRSGLQVS